MSSLAKALYIARTQGGLVDAREYILPTNSAGAYALQSEVSALFESETVGWKLGATSEKSLKLLGHERPFMGPLFAAHWSSNGAEVQINSEHLPSLETEFLVKLNADLPPRDETYSHDQVYAAIEYVAPAFEIVGCRMVGGYTEAGLMLIADSAANLAIVAGAATQDWRQADLSNHPISIEIDGAQVATGSSNLLLWGNPIMAVAWLAGHSGMGDRGLRCGDYIMTGTCGGMIPLEHGSCATADFGVLGSVDLTVRSA